MFNTYFHCNYIAMEGCFQCFHCSFKSSKKSNLIRHICNLYGFSPAISKVHCEHCSYITNSKFNLERHLSRFHLRGVDCNETHRKKSKIRIVCPVCGSKFRERIKLTEHLASVHNKTMEDETLIFESVSGKYVYTRS